MSISVKWLAVKTASEMTYVVSGGALNSTHSLTWVRLGTNDLNCVDVPLNPIHSLIQWASFPELLHLKPELQ